MKKFMDWLANSFAPKAKQLTQKPSVAGLSSAMQKLIPFIMTGSIVFFYNVFRSYIPQLPDLGNISNYSFGMIGMIAAFMVANQYMEKFKHPNYSITAGIVSVCVLMMTLHPVGAKEGVYDMGRVGPTGILIGVIVGAVVSVIFHYFSKLHLLQNSELPDFVVEWINNIIPIFLSLALWSTMIFALKIDVFEVIINLFEPIQSFGQSLPGLILLVLIPAFFYSMGISTWLWSAIQNPIFIAGIAANALALKNGDVGMNIVTNETVYSLGLIMMGGTGATLTLNLLMCFSKAKKLKTLGRICIGPSLFNINEPIVFSTPVVMNPILMMPMWINSITGSCVVWFAMRGGLLNIPQELMQVAQIPAPISSVMILQDFRAVLWYVLLFAMYLITWYPFFKVYEKEVLADEVKEEQAAEELSAPVEAV
ncbi:PTS transporter subunit EIIC [Enterococcus hulanensis]|uniref:Permease IIC component n=1 Tax=Enterococcus hulanensis TaxID=2559929 RepID=A0ABU3F3F4_9ENTE|nr:MULTISPECIES: PTS transporter subunit EIIC [Enterococcus]MBO0409852.1 PTS sugar transporter subunit IIC [Enterococcus hulanensis]MDT2601655.1 PTS transporter subunit EIIC [Enterococcus hulanensis]MDT2609203.1 PTS transporter subunit EIIC [Enterococcus hulanensis]MDT2616756.1 PTS transporter subunit EIIC [Enterococcus hulanensis]MDT2629533.1 PTS transporter subunit EIIC [Enterococcus hulanensis]